MVILHDRSDADRISWRLWMFRLVVVLSRNFKYLDYYSTVGSQICFTLDSQLFIFWSHIQPR